MLFQNTYVHILAQRMPCEQEGRPSCGCSVCLWWKYYRNSSRLNALVIGSCISTPCQKCYLSLQWQGIFIMANLLDYFQFMQFLDTIHPDVYQSFISGLHVIRRRDRCWAGLSTDLVIEQVLMRSLKTIGGLIQGTGISETQRLVWLLSIPVCRNKLYNASSQWCWIFHKWAACWYV